MENNFLRNPKHFAFLVRQYRKDRNLTLVKFRSICTHPVPKAAISAAETTGEATLRTITILIDTLGLNWDYHVTVPRSDHAQPSGKYLNFNSPSENDSSNKKYVPRIDEDLLHILWLKSQADRRPMTKVLNLILREALKDIDVEKLEAMVKTQLNIHGDKPHDS